MEKKAKFHPRFSGLAQSGIISCNKADIIMLVFNDFDTIYLLTTTSAKK